MLSLTSTSSRFLLVALVSAALAARPGPAATPDVAAKPTSTVEGRIFLPPGRVPDDAVYRALLAGGKRAPATLFEARKILEELGGDLETHIVGNRGFDNPEAGSFSFFESYTGPIPGGQSSKGEFFIGFFSERQGDKLAVQQSFEPGLMIELIAWDFTRKVFDFWELIGNGSASEWHLRGDSNDILSDMEQIGVGAARPAFGKRLRCSGCHSLGGPVLKELEPPHNDWWSTARKLKLGTIQLAPGPDRMDPVQLAGHLFLSATDAWNLGQQVELGLDRLLEARAGRGGDGQDLRHQLRPLFGTVEMNLVSDKEPFVGRKTVEVPEAFFVDTRLAGDAEAVAVDAALYSRALAKIGSKFAPDEVPGLTETRHAHLVPSRSYADNQAVTSLVKRGLLDEELVADVLAVDFTTPVYSRVRASLLRFIPEQATDAVELRAKLTAALRGGGADPAVKELLANLTDPARTVAFHRQRALDYLSVCRKHQGELDAVVDWLKIASQRRAEVAAAETSQNPRGRILEPGFRVIFPVDNLASKPGALRLSAVTARCESASGAR